MDVVRCALVGASPSYDDRASETFQVFFLFLLFLFEAVPGTLCGGIAKPNRFGLNRVALATGAN